MVVWQLEELIVGIFVVVLVRTVLSLVEEIGRKMWLTRQQKAFSWDYYPEIHY